VTTYALYNAKGGVGKTTSAVNLSYLSSREGRKTLLWDLDPQGSASFFFGVASEKGAGVKALVRGKRSLEDAIRPTAYENLHLVPADLSARKLDIYLNDVKDSKDRLHEMLGGLGGRYEAAFLDAPPGFSLLSDNLFRAADALLVPLIPTPLSVRTFLKILHYAETKGHDRRSILAFFTLVDSRRSGHREILSASLGREGGFLRASIPYSSDVERMGVRRAPLFVFSAASRAARAYEALWAEIRERTEGGAQAGDRG
jgi:cellulose biosynthesis protein BcsQ